MSMGWWWLGQAVFGSRCVACRRSGPSPFCDGCAPTLVLGARIALDDFEVHAALSYEGPVVKAVHAMKFHQAPEVAVQLGLLLGPLLVPDALLLPVPLTAEHARQRGYNQSRELCRRLGRPVWTSATRLGRSSSQRRRSRRERQTLGAQDFWVSPRVRGRAVVLVDDVVTTGATLKALAAAVHHAGGAVKRAVVLAQTRPSAAPNRLRHAPDAPTGGRGQS